MVEWNFLKIVAIFSGILLVLQLGMATWEKRTGREYEPLWKTATYSQAVLEWGVYMLLFLLCSLVLQVTVSLACRSCWL